MKRLLFLTVLCTGIAMFLAGPVCAKVTGVCSNCHTMHNSQGGSHMIINTTIDGESSGPEGGGYPSLTRGSCVGCHTGHNVVGSFPFVYDTDAVTYGTDTLAGGNFKWVVTDDAKGHNVLGIPDMTADGVLAAAPGKPAGGCANTCHTSLFNASTGGGPSMETGCDGCHLEPKHHAPQQADGTPALEANGYFRFLAGHNGAPTTGDGVEGIEEVDWELNAAAGVHNEYLGDVGSHLENLTGGFAELDNTMTAYCTGCHGNFHVQEDGSANWIRHPSDAVLPTDGEYAAYTVYDPIAPVARPDLTTIAATNTVVPGTDMVMCLSCHRAHGSPYDDLLRWEYSGMVAGGGGDTRGCFVCHTEKD